MNSISSYFVPAALLLALAGVALAQPNYCTQEMVVGTWAVAAQGTILMPGPGNSVLPIPAANLGIAAIELDGAMSSFSYNNVGGQITPGSMDGSITVNSDCTATVTWQTGITGTLLVLDEGKTMTSVMTSAGPMRNAVIYGDWKRISRVPNTLVAEQCAPNSFSGVYSLRMTGTIMVPQTGSTPAVAAPTVLLGIGSTHPNGTATGTAAASVGGQLMTMDVTAVDMPAINPDCTAMITWNHTAAGTPLGQSKQYVVVLDGGNEVWVLPVENFRGLPIQMATWTRISPVKTSAK